ncbi:class F sortase [Streptomyces marincola]|uniref:Class F sortase n=1 Tax=Streptomyces marincola TaxID=2878388 RepID=A0A1W7CXU9_9ACTN|nr:class F sortase [Streptomyces marincola]ARQ69582.1 hypothetical protein CAG99_12535 [Streptomyces marincola]
MPRVPRAPRVPRTSRVRRTPRAGHPGTAATPAARAVPRGRAVARAVSAVRRGAPRLVTAGRRLAGRAGTAARAARAAGAVTTVRSAVTGGRRRAARAVAPATAARPAARTRQQRLSVRSRRFEVAAAVAAITVGVLAGVLAPGSDDGVREARASSSIAEGVSRPGAVDAPAAAPDAGSTAGLDASISGQPSDVVAPPLDRADPTRVRIPQLGTDVEVFGADLAPDGAPPSPSEEDAMRAAWYAGGVSPGERGAALLVGHLDTYDGPAAFAGLGSLRPGENIEVDRADGRTAVFTVDSVEQYPKSDFPDERVYGAVENPQLRLITCGGRWTQDGGYDSNIVAYARLTSTTEGDAGAAQPPPAAEPVPAPDPVPVPVPVPEPGL